MGGSTKIQMPKAPDGAALARQQGESNLQASIATSLLNQVGETTPYGTVSYSQNPNQGTMIGNTYVPSYTRNVSLSPAQQAQLDAENATNLQMANLTRDNMSAVDAAQQAGFNWGGLPEQVSGINAAPIQGFNPNAGAIQSSLNTYNPMQNINTSGLMGLDPRAIQSQLDMNGLANINRDFSGEGARLEKATFDRGRALLEPQFGRAMSQAEVRLAERGLPLSSQAGGEILGGVQNEQNRALNELALSSIAAGRQEQGRLFGQDMASRQQGFGERQSMGNFANQAANQRFQQSSQGRQQQFDERNALFNATNMARGQAFAQNQAAGNFANQAQAQRFAQGMQSNALNNQLQQQSFNQAAQNAAMQNTARQNALQERSFARNMPINDMAALLGNTGGVQLPQFQQMPNVGVQAGDLLGATLGLRGQDIDIAKANQANSGGFLGGLMSLGGSLGSAAIMSDIRTKENIENVGLYRGHKLFSYNYKGTVSRVLGVMAQLVEQVKPEAVIEIGGIKHVKYGEL